MSTLELTVWVTQQFPPTWTHIIGGDFVNPQVATENAADLFCYDQNAGIGSFFATVKNGRLDDGTLVVDGAHQIGPNHTFSNRWTHVISGPSPAARLLFYDASSGVGEFYAPDSLGNLTLKKRHTNWRTSWTTIIAGRFGGANLLFYDAAGGTGEFYSVDDSGNIQLKRTITGWRTSWHSIITGNFSSSQYDDLLFYDKGAGSGEFYSFGDGTKMTLFSEHDNWRLSWQDIVSGQFSQTATSFDSLLFYEEGDGFTEFYSTDGHGSISQIDVVLGNQWALPWKFIFAGAFAPNLGVVGTSLCSYDSRDGVIRYFYLDPQTISTVLDLNGRWTDGSSRSAIISVSFTFLSINMSAFGRPAASGSIVDSSSIEVTFPDDRTYTGTLQAPNVIRWSNGSAWTKV